MAKPVLPLSNDGDSPRRGLPWHPNCDRTTPGTRGDRRALHGREIACEKAALKREWMALERLRVSHDRASAALARERAAMKQERMALERLRAALARERAAMKQERMALERLRAENTERFIALTWAEARRDALAGRLAAAAAVVPSAPPLDEKADDAAAVPSAPPLDAKADDAPPAYSDCYLQLRHTDV
jgi:hypothetical protein